MDTSDDTGTSPAQTSPPNSGIQAWAYLRLADGTRPLAAIPTSPKQARHVGHAREFEPEAEP